MKHLVDFKNDTTSEDIQNYITVNGCTVLQQYNVLDKVYLVESVTPPPVTDITEYVINDESSHLSLLETTMFQSQKVNDFEISDQKNWWKTASIFEIDFDNTTYSHRVYGEYVTVYLMDSGVDSTHPEFSGKSIQPFWSFNNDFTDNNGHGTALASLITGNTCGLTDATIKVVKILDNSGPTAMSQLVAAIDAILADQIPGKIGIVNISWCIPKNDYFNNKIQRLIDAGLFVVAAAGNNGTSIDEVSPACLPTVTTIGAYNENFMPCDFSNYTGSELSLTQDKVNGGALDGWAPGEKLWVAKPGGNYGWVAGTSFSAAIHTGALAYDIDCQHINDDGTMNPEILLYKNLLLDSFVLSRKGILTLIGVYSSSINKITTYAGKNVPMLNNMVMAPHIRVISGQPAALQMVSPVSVEKVIITPELPAGLTMTNIGYITGTVVVDPDAPDVSVTQHEFTIVTREGQTINHLLDLAVIKNDDFENLTIPEEYVWVTLSGTLCNSLSCGQLCPASNNNMPSRVCVVESKFNPICPICIY